MPVCGLTYSYAVESIEFATEMIRYLAITTAKDGGV
jgi:hypothetical protein